MKEEELPEFNKIETGIPLREPKNYIVREAGAPEIVDLESAKKIYSVAIVAESVKSLVAEEEDRDSQRS